MLSKRVRYSQSSAKAMEDEITCAEDSDNDHIYLGASVEELSKSFVA